MTCARLAESIDRRASGNTFSLNARSVTGVCGGSAAWNLFAAALRRDKSAMLPLTSSVATSSSGMFSFAKCVSGCSWLSLKTRKSFCVRPRTNRPSPSVTTTGTWTTSTSTRSAKSSFRVRDDCAICVPSSSVAVHAKDVLFDQGPASRSHSNGERCSSHTIAPSAKKRSRLTRTAADAGFDDRAKQHRPAHVCVVFGREDPQRRRRLRRESHRGHERDERQRPHGILREPADRPRSARRRCRQCVRRSPRAPPSRWRHGRPNSPSALRRSRAGSRTRASRERAPPAGAGRRARPRHGEQDRAPSWPSCRWRGVRRAGSRHLPRDSVQRDRPRVRSAAASPRVQAFGRDFGLSDPDELRQPEVVECRGGIARRDCRNHGPARLVHSGLGRQGRELRRLRQERARAFRPARDGRHEGVAVGVVMSVQAISRTVSARVRRSLSFRFGAAGRPVSSCRLRQRRDNPTSRPSKEPRNHPSTRSELFGRYIPRDVGRRWPGARS